MRSSFGKVHPVRIAAIAAAAIVIPGSAAAETLPPGGKVNKAVTANVTPDGLDFLLDQGLTLIPQQVAVPETSGSQSCGFGTVNYTIYQGQPTNGVSVEINSAQITPQQGYLGLSFSGIAKGTGTDDPPNDTGPQTYTVTRVEYSGCGTSCNDGDYSVVRLQPMNFAVSTELDIQLTVDPVTGEPTVDVTTPLSRNDISIDTSKVDAAGCAAIDFLVAVLKNFIGDAVKDEIIDLVNEQLLPGIEEGFQSIRYDDVVALADSELQVKLLPSALDIRQNGVAVSMSSQIQAVTPTTCVEIPTDAGSVFTPGEPPQYGTTAPNGLPYDAAASLSDDLVSQLLFSAWHSGMLCQTIDEGLTVDMLSLAGLSGPLNRLGIEDGTPILVVIKAYEPPTAAFADDPHVTLGVKKLEVSIFTTIQERTARLVALELEVEAGANILIDAANVLSIALDLAPEDIVGAVSYGELISSEEAETLVGLLPVLVEQFLPTLTDSLPTVDLGGLAGVGLENPVFVAEQGFGGVPDDTLSAYTGLVATGACGVGGTSGCGVGSTGGCAMGGRGAATQAGFFVVALAPIAVLLRRRRE